MRVSATRRLLSTFLSAVLLHAGLAIPVRSQETPAASVDPKVALNEARDLIKNGDLSQAVDLLKQTIELSNEDTGSLREAYLLLIKSYELWGIEELDSPRGRTGAEPYFKEARDVIAECLRNRALRHTQPEPVPEHMAQDFAQVRRDIFGSFRLTKLNPPAAVVLLEGDTLRVAPGDSLPSDTDLLVGPRRVVVTHPGYKDYTELVTIQANTIGTGVYDLSKRRSKRWYAAVGTGLAAGVGGVIALVAGNGGAAAAKPDPVLPDPPPPPAH